MATRKAARADYGIYAPYVVSNLSILGLICLILGLFGVTSKFGPLIQVQHILGWCFLGTFAIGSIEALYMVWSSKVGNYMERERVVDLLRLSGDERVLDVGCGRGLVLNAVAQRLKSGKAVGMDIWSKRDVSGNDPSETMTNAEIEGVAERVEIVDGDARRMPFEDNSFDAVTASLVLHNISNGEERRQAVREIYRVLKPGGRFAILDFQRTKEYADEFRKCGAVDIEVHGPHFLMFPPVKIVTGRKQDSLG